MNSSSGTEFHDRRRFHFRRAVLLFAILLAVPSYARRLHIRSFTPDDGLAGSQVWTILQDRSGYLWFGTATGVSRFDGTSFSSITVAGGLPDPLVRTIVETRDGHLWFGTNAGVAEYDGRTIVRHDAPPGPGRRAVWASAVDRDGRLWFGTQDGGLSVYDGRSFRTFTERDGLPGNYVYAIHCARDALRRQREPG